MAHPRDDVNHVLLLHVELGLFEEQRDCLKFPGLSQSNQSPQHKLHRNLSLPVTDFREVEYDRPSAFLHRLDEPGDCIWSKESGRSRNLDAHYKPVSGKLIVNGFHESFKVIEGERDVAVLSPKLDEVEVHGGFSRDVDKGRKIIVRDFVNGNHEHALKVALFREVRGERDHPICVSARRALVGLSQVEVLGIEVKDDREHVVVDKLEKQALCEVRFSRAFHAGDQVDSESIDKNVKGGVVRGERYAQIARRWKGQVQGIKKRVLGEYPDGCFRPADIKLAQACLKRPFRALVRLLLNEPPSYLCARQFLIGQ